MQKKQLYGHNMYDKGDGRSGDKSILQLVTHPISILVLGGILVAFLVVQKKDLKEKGNAPEQEIVESHEQEIVESHEQEITESPKQEETATEEPEVTERKYIPVETDDKYAIEVGYTMGEGKPKKIKK